MKPWYADPQWWTVGGTWLYVILVFVTLCFIYGQLREARTNRTLNAVLAAFGELQRPDTHEARRYILTALPSQLDGVEESVRARHLEKIRPATLAFHHVGYLIREDYLDPAYETIMGYTWPAAWRCWKKSEELIQGERRRRGEKGYMIGFEFLFKLSESYRLIHNYPEPRI